MIPRDAQMMIATTDIKAMKISAHALLESFFLWVIVVILCLITSFIMI